MACLQKHEHANYRNINGLACVAVPLLFFLSPYPLPILTPATKAKNKGDVTMYIDYLLSDIVMQSVTRRVTNALRFQV